MDVNWRTISFLSSKTTWNEYWRTCTTPTVRRWIGLLSFKRFHKSDFRNVNKCLFCTHQFTNRFKRIIKKNTWFNCLVRSGVSIIIWLSHKDWQQPNFQILFGWNRSLKPSRFFHLDRHPNRQYFAVEKLQSKMQKYRLFSFKNIYLWQSKKVWYKKIKQKYRRADLDRI